MGVSCTDCDFEYSETHPEPETPCPSCGSLRRTHTVTPAPIAVTLSMLPSAVLAHGGSVPQICLQAIFVPGEQTKEGVLIQALAPPWFEILRLLKANPNLAYELSPRKWEEMVAASYHSAGFDEVTITPASGDHGRDVIAVKKGFGSVRIIDQVKAFKPGHLVTANDVRALLGVLHGDPNATKGVVTTTSDFAPKITADPSINPFIPFRLELVNGVSLMERLSELIE